MDTRPVSFEDAVDRIFAQQRALMVRKQRDYGAGNITEFGEVGILVRASDKVQRLKNLLYTKRGQGTPSNEPIEDSWMDLLNYGLIAQMVRRGWWGLPLAENLPPVSTEHRIAGDGTITYDRT